MAGCEKINSKIVKAFHEGIILAVDNLKTMKRNCMKITPSKKKHATQFSGLTPFFIGYKKLQKQKL